MKTHKTFRTRIARLVLGATVAAAAAVGFVGAASAGNDLSDSEPSAKAFNYVHDYSFIVPDGNGEAGADGYLIWWDIDRTGATNQASSSLRFPEGFIAARPSGCRRWSPFSCPNHPRQEAV